MTPKGIDPQRFAEAVADVVEAARWDARIKSVRELADRTDGGMTHTSLNARFNKRTPFNVRDLAIIAPIIGVEPAEILRRARDLLDGGGTVAQFPARPSAPTTSAARKRPGKPKMGDD